MIPESVNSTQGVLEAVDFHTKSGILELDDGEATYFVEAPDEFGSDTFSPVEYARADEASDLDVKSHWGGGNAITNRLGRTDNATVKSISILSG